MSVRRLAALFALVICIISVMPMDISDADVSRHADCGNVTVMTFDISMDLDAGEEIPITVYITNNNDYPVSVELKETDGDEVSISLTSKIFTVGSETTETVPASLITDKYTPKGDYKVSMKVSVIDNMGTRTETGNDGLTIDVSVSSKFSSEGQYNKILGIFENNLPAPFDSIASVAVISAIGWLGIAIVAAIAAYCLTKLIFRKLKQDETKELSKKISISVLLTVIVYGTTVCLRVIGVDAKTLSSDFTLSNMLYVIIGAYILWCLYKGAVKLILLRNEDDDDSNDVDTSLIPLFNFVGKIVIVVIAVSYILYSFGFNVASVVAGAGIAGLGVSLGAKPAISEFFAGFALLTTHPFKIGDTVKIGGGEGLVVTKIGIMKTQLITSYTNDIITMPNSVIMSSNITNLSCEMKKYRNVMDVSIPYGTNIQLAKKLMKSAAGEHPNVIMDGSVSKPAVMFYSQKENNAITLRLAYYVKNFDVNGPTAGQIRESIIVKFRENGIRHPYQTRELNYHDMEGYDNA